MRAGLALLLAAALAGAGSLTAASQAEAPARAVAAATIVGGTTGVEGDVSVQGDGVDRRAGAAALPGVRVGGGEATVRAARRDGDALARATAVARSVSLLDGVVTAYGVRREVTADGATTAYSGRVDGLRIGGDTIGTVSDARSLDLPDHSGRVVLNHGASGLRVVLSRASHGHPAGTDIRVATVQAEATDGAPAAPVRADPSPEPQAAGRRPPARRRARRARAKRRPAPAARRRLTGGKFVFPVYGRASVADDWGAERQIGAHQGNDIFAPFGSPVLAVADGVVGKVGTLPISGNRLWLKTEGGDEFFYAHLSAFAPAAVNGRRVEAGTVLGFTGNTGDAEPTPPHVHFEIHPRGSRAIDPHAILLAWRKRRDVAPGAWLRRYGDEAASRPGALIPVRDFIAGE